MNIGKIILGAAAAGLVFVVARAAMGGTVADGAMRVSYRGYLIEIDTRPGATFGNYVIRRNGQEVVRGESAAGAAVEDIIAGAKLWVDYYKLQIDGAAKHVYSEILCGFDTNYEEASGQVSFVVRRLGGPVVFLGSAPDLDNALSVARLWIAANSTEPCEV